LVIQRVSISRHHIWAAGITSCESIEGVTHGTNDVRVHGAEGRVRAQQRQSRSSPLPLSRLP
jgi:hypothetical protein